MLKQSSLSFLRENKNLLAFSAGVDSTALLFLLHQNNIKFDIAIVNYGVREQSKEEVAYAQSLAMKYNFTCHTLDAQKITQNFEAKARAIRYDFFEELIKEYHYTNLITAHHLGDRFEWMLMQFCKGAGCIELSGMKEIQNRENFTLMRPLLHLDKSELLKYLQSQQIQYFEDETNFDESIKRNLFRHQHTQPLLEKHLRGIKKSFEYIDEDVDTLRQEIKISQINNLAYFKSSHNKRTDIFTIDKYLKQNHYLASAGEREQLKSTKTLVVGRKFIVTQENNFVFILPYEKEVEKISKEFKEECRLLKIEPKLRPYLYQNPEIFLKVKLLLTRV